LFPPAEIPLLYAGAMAMNGVAALAFGKLFDRFGIGLLSAGIAISALAVPLGFLGGAGEAIIAVACWGAGMGLQDATLRAGIARVVSMNKRGAAFGAFNAIFGIAWFAGSALMGFLYDRSIATLVIFGLAFQAIAAVSFLAMRTTSSAARSD